MLFKKIFEYYYAGICEKMFYYFVFSSLIVISYADTY